MVENFFVIQLAFAEIFGPQDFTIRTTPGLRKLLMSYIYQGNVEVSTEDLNDFLALAGELKVKGLTTDDYLDTLLEKQTSQNGNKKHRNQFTLPEEPVPNTITERDDIQPQPVVLVKQEEFKHFKPQ